MRKRLGHLEREVISMHRKNQELDRREQCMEVQGELAKARDKGLVRYVGFITSTRRWL